MNDLDAIRKKIDEVDKKLIEILAIRFSFISTIGNIKKLNNIEVMQPNRIDDVLSNVKSHAKREGISEEMIMKIYKIIISTSCDEENKITQNH